VSGGMLPPYQRTWMDPRITCEPLIKPDDPETLAVVLIGPCSSCGSRFFRRNDRDRYRPCRRCQKEAAL
jgi:hypothetical protein